MKNVKLKYSLFKLKDVATSEVSNLQYGVKYGITDSLKLN